VLYETTSLKPREAGSNAAAVPTVSPARDIAPSPATRMTSYDTFCKYLPAGLLISAVAMGLFLRAYWAIMLPYNDAPDEYSHYPMVRYLAEHYRPPTMQDVPNTIPVSYPALCPLGYVPLALPVIFMGTDHPYAYLAARLMNAALGTVLLVLIYFSVRLLFPSSRFLPVLVTLLAAMQPQLVFTSAYVNNDTTMLVTTAILWCLWLRLAEGDDRIRIYAAIGFVSGISLLCKTNSIGVILAGTPLVATLLVTGCWSANLRAILRRISVMALSFSAVCLPWGIWSIRHHHSLFGWEVHDRWWREFVLSSGIPQGFLTLDSLSDFILDTWDSLWGSFGYASVPLTRLDYMTIMLMTGIAVGSLITYGTVRPSTVEQRPSGRWKWMVVLFGTVCVWGAHLYHSAVFGMSPQGRYVLAALWPLLVLLASGWMLLGRSGWRSVITTSIVVMLFAFFQFSAVAEELQSNRIHQPDRRVRARLVGYAVDPPGRLPKPLPNLDVVGPAKFESVGDRIVLFTKNGGAIRWPSPINPSNCGGFLIEQQCLKGEVPIDGVLRVLSADGTNRLLAEIPYHDPVIGTSRFRFDLRRITKEHPSESILIEYQPDAQEAMLILRNVAVLDRSFEELPRH